LEFLQGVGAGYKKESGAGQLHMALASQCHLMCKQKAVTKNYIPTKKQKKKIRQKAKRVGQRYEVEVFVFAKCRQCTMAMWGCC